jgi:hypothetical protein
VFFAIGHALLDGPDYIAGFAYSNTNLALLIADHDNGAKAELFAPLHNFGNAANLNDAFLPVGFFLFSTRFFATVCHAFPQPHLHQATIGVSKSSLLQA